MEQLWWDPINATYTADAVGFQLNDSESNFLVTSGMFVKTDESAVEATAVAEIAIMGAPTKARLHSPHCSKRRGGFNNNHP